MNDNNGKANLSELCTGTVGATFGDCGIPRGRPDACKHQGSAQVGRSSYRTEPSPHNPRPYDDIICLAEFGGWPWVVLTILRLSILCHISQVRRCTYTTPVNKSATCGMISCSSRHSPLPCMSARTEVIT